MPSRLKRIEPHPQIKTSTDVAQQPGGQKSPPGFFVPVKTIEAKVGERVRAMRKQRGLLQCELAAAAGLPPRTVGRLERGEVDARLSTLTKIAVALKVDVKDLLP